MKLRKTLDPEHTIDQYLLPLQFGMPPNVCQEIVPLNPSGHQSWRELRIQISDAQEFMNVGMI
jgi:hypothetical protein